MTAGQRSHATITVLATSTLILVCFAALSNQQRLEAMAAQENCRVDNESMLAAKLSLEERLIKSQSHCNKLEFVIDVLYDSLPASRNFCVKEHKNKSTRD